MSKATSSTRSVMITRSLCPRSFWTCCANCTRMLPSSPKLEPLGREHNNCTSWAQRTVAPQLRSLWKFSFWTFCTANGKLKGFTQSDDLFKTNVEEMLRDKRHVLFTEGEFEKVGRVRVELSFARATLARAH